MAFISLQDLADQFQRTYAFESSEQALAVMSRVLIDKSGNVVMAADDLSTALTNILASTGAANSVNSITDIVSSSIPLAADTVTASASKANETVNLVPAGTLATLTFTFPTEANSRIGQVLRLTSTQIVTALTVSSSGLTLRGTAVTALAVNTPVVFLKVSASTWLRLS